jgi:hypothetical protein
MVAEKPDVSVDCLCNMRNYIYVQLLSNTYTVYLLSQHSTEAVTESYTPIERAGRAVGTVKHVQVRARSKEGARETV